MAKESAQSTFSASAHGPGYWFGMAAFAAVVAVVVVVFNIVEVASIGFVMPVLVGLFCLVQGVRSMSARH
ncbi:MAG: hypothetical protein WBG36_09720 [Ornithinimicrobium sp.]